MEMALVDVIISCTDSIKQISEHIEGAIVYLDAGTTESFQLIGAYALLLDLGARAVCSLESMCALDTVRRPHKTISLNMCVMSRASSESVSHLFLHCPTIWLLWNNFLSIFQECWVCPTSLDKFLIMSFVGFGNKKEARILWQCAIHAIIWTIWLERNSRFFKGRFSEVEVLWNNIRHLASVWCKAYYLFRGFSISDMSRDWETMFHK